MTVKGSKQDKLVVVSYDPWSQFWRRLLLLILVVVLGGASYVYGRLESREIQAKAIAERDQLLGDLKVAQEKVASFGNRVSYLEKSGDVGRISTESLRQNMVDLHEQIATLQEEVAFYKGIMAPSTRKHDLRIQKMEIVKALEKNRFRYKLVVTQVGTNQTYISGLAALNVKGIENGKQKIYGLRDISDDVQDYGIKFKFRYFQEIAGDLVLPVGFTPELVEVVLQSKGTKAGRVTQTTPWPGKEQKNAKQ
ncbi:MAG: DUF6776 family protein [Bermanella sp.]